MNWRYVIGILVLLAGVSPYIGIGMPSIAEEQQTSANASIHVYNKWSWWHDDSAEGGYDGRVKTYITNNENYTIIVTGSVTPVDERGVKYNEHTFSAHTIEPNETVLISQRWRNANQNANEWDGMDMYLRTCKYRMIGHGISCEDVR